MKLFASILFALMTTFVSPAFSADLPPDVLIKNTAEEVLAIVKKDKDIQGGNQQKIFDLAEQKVLPHFDFARMTRLAVGRYWRQATPEQQKALVNEFKDMLVRTYSTALSQYKNQTIEYKPFSMQPGETDVVVKTQVIQPGGQPIPIDYSMSKTADGWKVYDIAVDGVSLVINYRPTFATEIRNNGIDGLIKTLADKNKSIKGGAVAGATKKAG
jgi:phospholipid transport system substrate-binding protein